MEQDIKQQTVVYNKGITNVPSELLSTDGELVSCEGMTFESGELKPIQKAVANGLQIPEDDAEGVLVCVHDGRIVYQIGNKLKYRKDVSNYGEVMTYSGTLKDVTTVGNTVIAATSEEMHYALWTGSSYKDLGNKIPEPNVTLKLCKDMFGQGFITSSEAKNAAGIIGHGAAQEVEDQQAWNDFVFGIFEECRTRAKQKKGFCMPFAARFAVRLYDGTYIKQSSPIIFYPSITRNFLLIRGNMQDGVAYWEGSMEAYFLYYKNESDYSDWSDIVEGIDLFVSREINIYNTATGNATAPTLEDNMKWNDYIAANSLDSTKTQLYGEQTSSRNAASVTTTNVLPTRTTSDVVEELGETSLFYKLCELPSSDDYRKVTGYKDTDLENLETLSILEDDYYSHVALFGSSIFSYNGRLSVCNLQRDFFEGFGHFIGYDNSTSTSYEVKVAIKTKSGYKIVTKNITTSEKIGWYFFYPDRRAEFLSINGTTIKLKEHPGLNGAYTIISPLTTSLSSSGTFPVSNIYSGNAEHLPSTIATSEVDNPFVFTAKGYNTVGNGEIKGMAAVTMALSEYQHGKQPLVVFSTDGIWSLTVNSEGYYNAIQAVSREVCNNAKSITQVDMGVYFTSAKGLMYLDTSGVTCVSEQMKGTSFEDFIDTCSIAYDYRDSLLHIFVEDSEYHYVYNMKSGTFSTMADTDLYYKAVNNYPDTLIQTENDNILSLLSKPDEKDDQNVYEGTLVTRAIKFGNLLTLKSIRQMKHLYRVKAWKQGSWTGHQNVKFSVALTLKASNDGYQWATVHSLRGKPWRYWRFELALGNMSAADRLAGTVVWTQERRMEKIR